MGNRGNIFIKDTGIYLYAHWEGSGLPDILKAALIRGETRWNDPAYLTRIIFSEMVKEDVLGTTGYGIANFICDNENPILTVDCKNQTVTFEGDLAGIPFKEFVR